MKKNKKTIFKMLNKNNKKLKNKITPPIPYKIDRSNVIMKTSLRSQRSSTKENNMHN